jgi:dipeptidyl aminopeptidase/acylaminoacyl peptidase
MKRFTLAVLLLIILAGCSNAAPAAPPLPMPTVHAVIEISTATPIPSASPTGTQIPTATPIPDPMTIQAMRAGNYPGSDIVIESELDRGWNYRRYYAWYESEGLKIYGLLTIPEGEMPAGGFPAIIFNHGYIPPNVYRTTERYLAYVDRIASAGYVVFRIDYRGHDRSEGEASGAYGSPGYTIDVLNAVASIKRHPQVNPEKIGMWGHSMGGYLTLRSMVITNDIKVGVIWAGVVASYTDLIYNWRRTGAFTPSPSSTGRGWRTRWIEQYGAPEQNPEFWSAVSANTYVGDLSGPLQLHHGTNDEDVPLAFSIRLAEEVRAVGGIADLYTYDGDNHNISKYFTTAMDRTIAFYDQHLK